MAEASEARRGSLEPRKLQHVESLDIFRGFKMFKTFQDVSFAHQNLPSQWVWSLLLSRHESGRWSCESRSKPSTAVKERNANLQRLEEHFRVAYPVFCIGQQAKKQNQIIVTCVIDCHCISTIIVLCWIRWGFDGCDNFVLGNPIYAPDNHHSAFGCLLVHLSPSKLANSWSNQTFTKTRPWRPTVTSNRRHARWENSPSICISNATDAGNKHRRSNCNATWNLPDLIEGRRAVQKTKQVDPWVSIQPGQDLFFGSLDKHWTQYRPETLGSYHLKTSREALT